jgi:hypothetical protein
MLKDLSLERLRIFPYIAWGLVISFSVFVYTLTIQLKQATADLRQTAIANEVRAHQDPLQIKEFSH